jgi:hypothetical protein|tara:strand:- start:4948 stop:5418 length:471 start_codon:yes stop_codon:yes gene_type:complete
MAKTVDEFIAQLEEFGQRAVDLSDILSQVGSEITTQIKNNLRTGPDATGALKSSISFEVNQDSLTLEMLNYGVFQNYGVGGTKSSPATLKPVEGGIFGIPAGTRFRFKSLTIGGSLPYPVRRSIVERGLQAKSFFNIQDISQEVALRLEEEINIFN